MDLHLFGGQQMVAMSWRFSKSRKMQMVQMGVSENVVYPIYPMVLLIIIPIKWLFHWEYTLFSDKPKSWKSLPSGYVNSLLLKMTIEIVDLPIENGGSFHSYVKLWHLKATLFSGSGYCAKKWPVAPRHLPWPQPQCPALSQHLETS